MASCHSLVSVSGADHVTREVWVQSVYWRSSNACRLPPDRQQGWLLPGYAWLGCCRSRFIGEGGSQDRCPLSRGSPLKRLLPGERENPPVGRPLG
jgi:hypothetical protein